MNLIFNTYVISPHSWPMIRDLARLYPDVHVDYFYQSRKVEENRTNAILAEAGKIARLVDAKSAGFFKACAEVDYLVEGERDLDIILDRVRCGRPTVYMSERWFKPIRIGNRKSQENSTGSGIRIPGFLRMVLPFGIKRALRMKRLMEGRKPFYYLPIGIRAAEDMARMIGLLHGELSCLFHAPQLEYEHCAGGRIFAKNGKDHLYGTDRMRMWGYFVDQGAEVHGEKGMNVRTRTRSLRVLWIGRMIGCKRVDTIIRAVGGVENLELGLYGAGPKERQIRQMASMFKNIHVGGAMTLTEVRAKMREYDLFVLSSNDFEGWGAVVNEALEEGLKVVGTYEAGASATILPGSNLFHAGDWRRLREILAHPIPDIRIGDWSVKSAAKALVTMYRDLSREH